MCELTLTWHSGCETPVEAESWRINQETQMNFKSKTLMALAVAGTFACAGAFAGGGHHGAQMGSQMGSQTQLGSQSSYEVQTPASVNESAPWLTNHATLHGTQHSGTTIGFQEGQFSDGPVGTGSAMSGTGTGGYDSSPSTSDDLSMSDMQTFDNGDSFSYVEYWLLGEEPSATGVSSSAGATGSGGFDSTSTSPDSTSMSATGSGDYSYTTSWDDPLSFVGTSSADDVIGMVGEETPLLSEHYLVYGPISSFDGHNVIVLELGPGAEDVALLDALSRDFYVLTPIYEEG
jgi:hypothetical protein